MTKGLENQGMTRWGTLLEAERASQGLIQPLLHDFRTNACKVATSQYYKPWQRTGILE